MQYDNHKNPISESMVSSFLNDNNIYSYFGPNNCIYGNLKSRKYVYNANDYPVTEHDSSFVGTERISDFTFSYNCK